MFEDIGDQYYDAFESPPYRSRMKTLDWSQWGTCPTCNAEPGKECLNMNPLVQMYDEGARVTRLRMRPHWNRNVTVYPMCQVCDEKGYFLNPLRTCVECGGKGQLQDQPSEQWWYEIWQATGENLWAFNNLE